MFNKITDNVEIHQTLPDIPNMTSQELKREWDKGCKIIKEAFNKLVDEMNNNMFPIGFRMFVNNDKDYSKHLGFTWQKVAKGKVLVGKDENDEDFNTIGKKGGEKTHTLTIKEMPEHAVSITIGRSGDATHNHYSGNNNIVAEAAKGTSDSYECSTSKIGGNQPHINMQPYEVVNIWERIL